jgi:L-threonylcarbamoyladenylate synthase
VSHRLSTPVLVVDPERPDPAALDEAARILRQGGLVAFATETVYGLGAVATDERAVARIYLAKGRPAINPLIVHVADLDQARGCATDWPATADRLAAHFWPGPLTLVLNRAVRIPDIVSAGKPTVGLRMPATRVARGLIERTGEPLAAPSANRSNRLSPTRAEHVLADLDRLIDLVLDSGPTALGLESTVLDVTIEPPRLLRPGPITTSELESVLSGRSVRMPTAGESVERPSSPGQLPIHYSPRTPSFRIDSPEELVLIPDLEGIALVSFGERRVSVSLPIAREFRLGSPTEAARLLYDVLHQCDSLDVRSIIVLMPPDRPEWLAIRDRLLRATRPLAKNVGQAFQPDSSETSGWKA